MINTENLFHVLSSIHPLSRNFKEALSKELQIRAYPKNYFLLQEKSVAQYAYFLEDGFAAAYHFYNGKKVVTRFFDNNHFVLSPQSFFDQREATETIQLTVDSELITISHASVSILFEKFNIANALARSITAEYLSKTQQRIVDLHELSAWERYLKLLADYPGIELKVSQDLIASYLNITPQSLSRLKHENN